MKCFENKPDLNTCVQSGYELSQQKLLWYWYPGISWNFWILGNFGEISQPTFAKLKRKFCEMKEFFIKSSKIKLMNCNFKISLIWICKFSELDSDHVQNQMRPTLYFAKHRCSGEKISDLWTGSGSRSESNETTQIIWKWTKIAKYSKTNFTFKLCIRNFATFICEISLNKF
jgi:hypothetical protein